MIYVKNKIDRLKSGSLLAHRVMSEFNNNDLSGCLFREISENDNRFAFCERSETGEYN